MMLVIIQEEPSGEGADLREGKGRLPPGEPPQAQEDLPGPHTGVLACLPSDHQMFCKLENQS